jgi:hypothetical protein
MEDDPGDITDEEDWTAVRASASRATFLPNMDSSDSLQDLDLPERAYLPPPTESPRKRVSKAKQSESDISTIPPPEPPLEIAPRISETGNPAILQTRETLKGTMFLSNLRKLEHHRVQKHQKARMCPPCLVTLRRLAITTFPQSIQFAPACPSSFWFIP